jgi:hypothetical protein
MHTLFAGVPVDEDYEYAIGYNDGGDYFGHFVLWLVRIGAYAAATIKATLLAAEIGTSFGPWGSTIGAVVGLVGGTATSIALEAGWTTLMWQGDSC